MSIKFTIWMLIQFVLFLLTMWATTLNGYRIDLVTDTALLITALMSLIFATCLPLIVFGEFTYKKLQ